MEIIREGCLGGEISKKYKFECRKCGCVFVCAESETEKRPDYRNGSMRLHKCPTCSFDVYGQEVVMRNG